MSSSGSSSNTPVVVIHRSKIARADEGRRVVCAEFKQVRYPFKWRKYICARCGELRGEHGTSKANVDDGTRIREGDLPLRKRLILRYKWDQDALAASIAATREKGKEEGELEKGETSWIPGVMIIKGKRAPRRRRADVPLCLSASPACYVGAELV